MNKKQMYNRIMESVAREVKKALNEDLSMGLSEKEIVSNFIDYLADYYEITPDNRAEINSIYYSNDEDPVKFLFDPDFYVEEYISEYLLDANVNITIDELKNMCKKYPDIIQKNFIEWKLIGEGFYWIEFNYVDDDDCPETSKLMKLKFGITLTEWSNFLCDNVPYCDSDGITKSSAGESTLEEVDALDELEINGHGIWKIVWFLQELDDVMDYISQHCCGCDLVLSVQEV